MLDQTKLLARLLTKNKMPLQFICYSLDLLKDLPESASPGKSKEQLGKLLIDWVRCLMTFSTSALPYPSLLASENAVVNRPGHSTAHYG